jgi:hypothetical protein
MPWIENGFPVIPVKRTTKGRCTRRGTEPTRQAGQVAQWSRQYPKANVGVVLNGLRVVVLDCDGEVGEASLAQMLADARAELPDTYQESTGRDQGRHIWLRLPESVPSLCNQSGGQAGKYPHLDVLSNGHIVAAGSVHRSGRRYTALGGVIPRRDDLAEMPLGIYDLLARRGRIDPRQAGHEAHRVGDAPVSHIGHARGQAAGALTPPRTVADMLVDTSDGRDRRAFRVACTLVRRGWADDEIVEMVLRSPLGDKAREQRPSEPRAWVLHKIGWSRGQDLEPLFDPVRYWQEMHTSGLTASQVRVLDCMLGCARHSGGVVSISTRKIAIGAASSKVDGVVRGLIDDGWLTLLREADIFQSIPRRYRLTSPSRKEGANQGRDDELPGQTPPTPSPLYEVLSGWYAVTPSGHDALRHRKGSLSAAYPVLGLLGPEPVTPDMLVRWTSMTPVASATSSRTWSSTGSPSESAVGSC